MTTSILLNTVNLENGGPRRLRSGTTVDSALGLDVAIQAAGGVLWPASDPIVAAQAAFVQKLRARGLDDVECSLMMLSAAAQSAASSTVAVVTTANSPYAVKATDALVEVDEDQAVVVQLEAAPVAARRVLVKCTATGAGSASVDPGSSTIEDPTRPGIYMAGPVGVGGEPGAFAEYVRGTGGAWRLASSRAKIYTPAMLVGNVISLDAARGGMLVDLSGKGNNFAAVGAPNVSSSAGPGGAPALRLNGTTQYTALARAITLGAGFSSVVIAKLYSTSLANSGVFSAADNGNDYTSANGMLTWGSGYNTGLPSGLNSIVDGASSSNLTLAMDVWHVVALEVEAVTGTTTLTVDGVNVFTGTAAGDTITPTLWTFGSRVLSGAAGTSLAKCDLAGAFVYSEKLSTPDRAALGEFIKSEWGLVL